MNNEMIRLWHDDIRPAPVGWTIWARTNDVAKEVLRTGKVVEISMDHDLGLDGYESKPPEMGGNFDSYDEYVQRISMRGTGPETGEDLARWMAAEGIIPKRITIHSWNPLGAQRMANILFEAGGSPVIKAFEVPR